jgi:hypothetical protein
MNALRDRLQELADGYARSIHPPGPAAARRRGRQRRRRAVAGVILAGLLVVAGSVGLLPALKLPRPSQPVGPRPTPTPVQVPRFTTWFRATYLPGGFRLVGELERPAQRGGPPIRGAQAFRLVNRLVKGNGEFTVSVNPSLRHLDVTRERRTYPTVRVVQVRGHAGLLFPRRPDNFYTGLTWEERPGLVMQVLGSQGLPDRMLLDVAEGLRIVGTAGGNVTITVGPRPPGWIRVGRGTRWATIGDYLTVLPRSHHLVFNTGRGAERSKLVVTETRGQYGPLRSADKRKLVPDTRREAVTVHGYPALLDHDPVNHFLEVTWREPGGIELSVRADEQLGRREVLAVAEGLRQPR